MAYFSNYSDSIIECIFNYRPDFTIYAQQHNVQVATVAQKRLFLEWWWPVRGDSRQIATPDLWIAPMNCSGGGLGLPVDNNMLIVLGLAALVGGWFFLKSKD